MKALKYIIIPALAAAMAACGSDPAPMKVSRLDRAMQAYKDAPDSSRQIISDTLSAEISALFKVLGHTPAGETELEWWSGSDEVAVFQPDADKAFPDLAELEATLGRIYRNAAREGLRLDTLRFASVVYGLPQPLLRVDSVMLIALNHYLGSDYPGYSHWEAYKRAGKAPGALPYDLAAAIVATSHPMACGAEAPTLLSNMLYEGALAEARMRLLPDPDEAAALGLLPEEMKFMQAHLPQMWMEMAEKKMIYDTNQVTSDRMLSAAPSSPLLGSTAPARAGRYIGHQIVRAYMKSHPGTSLAFLLSPEFYSRSATLAQSGFNPAKPI